MSSDAQVALAKPKGFDQFPLKDFQEKRTRCEAPQGRPTVIAYAMRPRSIEQSSISVSAKQRATPSSSLKHTIRPVSRDKSSCARLAAQTFQSILLSNKINGLS